MLVAILSVVGIYITCLSLGATLSHRLGLKRAQSTTFKPSKWNGDRIFLCITYAFAFIAGPIFISFFRPISPGIFVDILVLLILLLLTTSIYFIGCNVINKKMLPVVIAKELHMPVATIIVKEKFINICQASWQVQEAYRKACIRRKQGLTDVLEIVKDAHGYIKEHPELPADHLAKIEQIEKDTLEYINITH